MKFAFLFVVVFQLSFVATSSHASRLTMADAEANEEQTDEYPYFTRLKGIFNKSNKIFKQEDYPGFGGTPEQVRSTIRSYFTDKQWASMLREVKDASAQFKFKYPFSLNRLFVYTEQLSMLVTDGGVHYNENNDTFSLYDGYRYFDIKLCNGSCRGGPTGNDFEHDFFTGKLMNYRIHGAVFELQFDAKQGLVGQVKFEGSTVVETVEFRLTKGSNGNPGVLIGQYRNEFGKVIAYRHYMNFEDTKANNIFFADYFDSKRAEETTRIRKMNDVSTNDALIGTF